MMVKSSGELKVEELLYTPAGDRALFCNQHDYPVCIENPSDCFEGGESFC